jgi:hypothetical protein
MVAALFERWRLVIMVVIFDGKIYKVAGWFVLQKVK